MTKKELEKLVEELRKENYDLNEKLKRGAVQYENRLQDWNLLREDIKVARKQRDEMQTLAKNFNTEVEELKIKLQYLQKELEIETTMVKELQTLTMMF